MNKGNPSQSMKPKTHYRHMDREKANEIRRAYLSREGTQCQLAEWHGISQGSVSRIVSGAVWAGHFGED